MFGHMKDVEQKKQSAGVINYFLRFILLDPTVHILNKLY